jgi:hypothetical protein
MFNIESISMSSSGQYQTLASTPAYTSSDFGNTWKVLNTMSLTNIAVSSSGQYQTGVNYGGKIYASSDFGNTWSDINISSAPWSCIGMSAQGDIQVACLDNVSNKLYISTNYGANWSSINYSAITSIISINISASGLYQYIVNNNNGNYTLHYSIDGGNNWAIDNTCPVPSGYFINVTASASGQFVTILSGEGYLYTKQKYISVGPSFTDGTYGSANTIPIIGVTGGVITSLSTCAKSFIIDHPTNNNKYLVHGCLEGPESGIYYRGKSEIIDNESIVISLPKYVENIGYDFTIQITPIGNCKKVNNYCTSDIVNNEFTVFGDNGKFFWLVQAKRGDIEVEPYKTNVMVKGSGPYRWI